MGLPKLPSDHYYCPVKNINGKLYAICQDYGPFWGPHHDSTEHVAGVAMPWWAFVLMNRSNAKLRPPKIDPFERS